MIMREAVVEGSGNLHHVQFFNVAQNMGLNISPASKYSHRGWDSIPWLLDQQLSAAATKAQWQGDISK